MFKVLSIFAHTGLARASTMASTVATNVKLCVITSSFGLRSKTDNATRNAAVPELTARLYGDDIFLENDFSNSST